eukprot:3011312-Prymnesium_polylepis.1
MTAGASFATTAGSSKCTISSAILRTYGSECLRASAKKGAYAACTSESSSPNVFSAASITYLSLSQEPPIQFPCTCLSLSDQNPRKAMIAGACFTSTAGSSSPSSSDVLPLSFNASASCNVPSASSVSYTWATPNSLRSSIVLFSASSRFAERAEAERNLADTASPEQRAAIQRRYWSSRSHSRSHSSRSKRSSVAGVSSSAYGLSCSSLVHRSIQFVSVWSVSRTGWMSVWSVSRLYHECMECISMSKMRAARRRE